MKSQIKTASRITLNYLLVVCLGFLIAFQVYISNQIATSGLQLSELDKRASILEDENRKLLSKNVDYLSLHQLADKAKTLGYQEPEKVLNLGGNTNNLALK